MDITTQINSVNNILLNILGNIKLTKIVSALKRQTLFSTEIKKCSYEIIRQKEFYLLFYSIEMHIDLE